MADKILRTNTLSLKEKVEVIRLKEQKCSVKELCEKFKCGKTQIYEAIKRKDELLKDYDEIGCSIRKRKRPVVNEDIDRLTWQWYSNAKAMNLQISGTLLREIAKEIAEKLGNGKFKASNGWLVSFRNRHGIKMQQISKEPNSIIEQESLKID